MIAMSGQAFNWKDILFGVTSIVTGASIIAKLTPWKGDDKILAELMKIINLLAINPKK